MQQSFVPVAILGSVCLTIFMPVNSFSQVKGDQPTKRLEFEAASVKPSASTRLLGTMVRDGKLTATGISLKALIALAYDVREAEISEGPNWVGSERYDMNAKAAGPAGISDLKLMIRALLEDRFQLQTHRETKEMPVYALIIGKNGPKLKASNNLDCTDPSVYTPPPQLPTPGQPVRPVNIRCGNFYVLNDRLQGRKVTLRQLASTLSNMNIVEQRVVDQSGIAGTFDIDLQWDASPGTSTRSTDTIPDNANLPPIFEAFQEQLGLKLQSQRSPVDVLVIDNAAKPTSN
jgi:uncharacterized protein (TIGR03435 family)